MASITISGQNWARRPQLVLRFLDLDEPLPNLADNPKYRLADRDDIEAGLAFARGRQRLLVHCHAGISRSTAMTLGILTERLGDPQAALAEMLRLQPHAVPNRHIVRLLDDILHLHGALDKMIQAWERPSHQRWRTLNRRAHLLDIF